MQHKIIGTTMPVLEMSLDPGDRVIAEAGELSWLTSTIALHTSTSAGANKGFLGAIKRAVGGGTLFMTEYTANGGPGMVAFATKVPGHILPVEVTRNSGYLIHRHGFLCGTAGIELSVGFQRSLGAGVFGGQGFVLQKIAGEGTSWIELDGEVVTYDLSPGETLRVHPGHVGMFEGTVNFDITMLPGIRNILFGGDGLFLAALTGPGRVWLQSLPLSNLAHALAQYLPSGRGADSAGNAAGAGLAGAVIGGLLGGNRDD
ncbi:MAG TPA: TIGR00266 family protein [Chloroflexota bacterium]|nr:TIGR00266 family protein [Chloroflexota bacterium]